MKHYDTLSTFYRQRIDQEELDKVMEACDMVHYVCSFFMYIVHIMFIVFFVGGSKELTVLYSP